MQHAAERLREELGSHRDALTVRTRSPALDRALFELDPENETVG
jgi:hypothetical protein